MDIGEISGIVGNALASTTDLTSEGYKVQALDTGEVFMRAPDGAIYMLDVTLVEADAFADMGVEFND